MAFCFHPEDFDAKMKNSEFHLYNERIQKYRRKERARSGNRLFSQLRATAAVACMLSSSLVQPVFARRPAPQTAPPAPNLPAEPQPNFTPPFVLRPGQRDYSKPNSPFPSILKPYEPINVPPPVTLNSGRLSDLLRGGKIYLSLSDAIVLALENNYDIAIQRYNLDIANTDLLRARAGSNLLGVSSGLVEGTLSGLASSVNSLSSEAALAAPLPRSAALEPAPEAS